MENSNIFGGIAIVISIISLVLTPFINLWSKKLEKRLEYRFQLFQKILELRKFYMIQELRKQMNLTPIEQDDRPLLLDVGIEIQLYGYKPEIKSYRKFEKSRNNYVGDQTNEDKNKEFLTTLNKFLETSFNRYRKELLLGKLEDVTLEDDTNDIDK